MKKRIFGGIVILAIAAVAAFNVNLTSQKSELSGISLANADVLANAEALATEEGASSNPKNCWNSVEYRTGQTSTHKTYCGDCAAILCTHWYTEKTCK
jgi:hypothetical protein